jgi:hypothetical protein
MDWQTSWPLIMREVETIDQTAFLRDVANAVATRSRAPVTRRRKPLTPEQTVLIEALSALQAAVIRGAVTTEELPQLRAWASAKAKAAKEAKKAKALAKASAPATPPPSRKRGKKPAPRGRGPARR